MGSKLMSLGLAVFFLVFLGLMGLISELVRERALVVGYPSGRMYFLQNESFVNTPITNLRDMCQGWAISSDGNIFRGWELLFTLPEKQAHWCAWRRGSLFVGGPLAVYRVYPTLQKQLWTLGNAGYAGWKLDEWITSDEPFKFNPNNVDKQVVIRDGNLIDSIVTKVPVGKDAVCVDWV